MKLHWGQALQFCNEVVPCLGGFIRFKGKPLVDTMGFTPKTVGFLEKKSLPFNILQPIPRSCHRSVALLSCSARDSFNPLSSGHDHTHWGDRIAVSIKLTRGVLWVQSCEHPWSGDHDNMESYSHNL